MRLRIFHQFAGRVILEHLAVREHQHSVTLDDRVEAMRNRDHSRVGELLLDQLLNLLFSYNIDIGSGLVEHHHLVLAQDCPADADELPLASAKISSALSNLKVNAGPLLLFALSIAIRGVQIVCILDVRDLSLVFELFCCHRVRCFRLSVEQITQAAFDQKLFNCSV